MTPTDFDRRIAAALPNCGELRILVAVSGGADSVGMLLALNSLRSATAVELRKLHAAHFNHRLRGEESDADAAWVGHLCRDLDVEITIGSAALTGSSEESARNQRYEFLAQTAREIGYGFVATAHTADDQAETILHHVLRGTGVAGLRGMPAERRLGESDKGEFIRLIRPMLGLHRSDVEEYLGSLGQSFREDRTNVDEQFTRNRIRHSLLPLLREQFNPRVDEALLKLSQQAGEATEALECLAADLLDRAVLEQTGAICRLNRNVLQKAHPSLVRWALVRLWDRAQWPRQMMSFDDWHRTAALVHETGAVTLPGNIDVRPRGDTLILRRASVRECGE